MTNQANELNQLPEKWLTCDGRQFKLLFQAGLYWLEKHQQIVNALNVFPVPDGDTGTNMLLTMRSAWRAVQNSDEHHVGKMTQAISRGALMGARGNSGVILSQIWRGMAKALDGLESFDAAQWGQAFEEAANTAYGGVMKPVEGTILTVVREGAEEALDAAEKSTDLRFVLRRALTRSNQSLQRTPDLLPILKQAGVVDSGGQGLVYILEGMHRFATGAMTVAEMTAAPAADATAANAPAQALVAPEDGVLENHYDVQFILLGQNLNVAEVRQTIDAMGDSTVVVGDESTIKVHIHVDDPGEPLTYGISLGEITDVVVENMQMQMDDIITTGTVHTDASIAPIGIAAQQQVAEVMVQPGQIAVVAVAAGDGISNIFKDLGVFGIVAGGQTNNPSTEEIYAAIVQAPTDQVIILPNNKNIILAAEAARDIAHDNGDKRVAVVPTRTAPQGFSAMMGFDPDGDLNDIAEGMVDLANDVVTCELTIATRTVEIDGVAVDEGNMIGLVNGKLCTAGTELEPVLDDVLSRVDDIDDREIISLLYGADISQAEAQQVANRIVANYPDLEVEIQSGGQAHYFYILGIE